tara:strand:+ start:204 stop:1514 length:1311 start_codon:yes stop_codon:yes gene_type:complete
MPILEKKNNIIYLYFNILFILIVPSFVAGQFFFKLVLIFVILSGTVLFKNKLFLFEKNSINLIFIFLLLYFFLNSIFVSSFYYDFNTRYLTFAGIILFFLITNHLIKKNLINLNLIFSSYIIFFFLIYIDTIYQTIFLKDLFGYKYLHGYQRFAGPFGDEYILGGFMSFFIFPTIVLSYFSKRNNPIIKFLYLIFVLISIYIALKTGERIAFFTILLQCFLFFLFFKFNIKNLLVMFFAIVVILSTIFFDKGVQQKYNHFFKLLFNYQKIISVDKSNQKEEIKKTINKISFFNTQSGAHFLTAYEIWKNYKIFGIGIKNFRNESSKEIYSSIKSHQVKYRVATHPHNYQLEILSETGLFGFILFNILLLILIYNFIWLNRRNMNISIYLKVFIIVVISKYFPFKTDSSIFSSSLGLLFWIFLIYAICSYNKMIKTK